MEIEELSIRSVAKSRTIKAERELAQGEESLCAAHNLIQAGRYEEAHRLLLALVKSEADNPDVWLLLGWTAPMQSTARACFEHLLRLEPVNSLPQDGLAIINNQREALPDDDTRPLLLFALKRREAASQAPDLSEKRQQIGQAPSMGLALPKTLGILCMYLMGLALAEGVTAFLQPQAGLAIHGGLLVLLFLHAALWSKGNMQKLLYCLALAPLIRLLSLSMPLVHFQTVYWYTIIGIPLFLAALMAMRLVGYKPAEVGLGRGEGWLLQVLAGLSGLGLGYLEYLILHPEPLTSELRLELIWLPALILLVFTGFLEELIFRGLLQRASQAVLGSLGPLFVSLVFAILHIGYRSLADFAFVFAVGLLFSVVVERTRSIWGVTLAHGLTNIALFLIFPFLLQ